MRFIRPSVARAQIRAAASQGNQERLEKLESTLLAIRDAVGGVKVPNGTTKRVARLVNEALDS